MRHLHAERAQFLGRPDAGEQQKLRRVDGAAGEQNLPFGAGNVPLALSHILDADGAAVLDHDAGRLRLGQDGEIFARRGRMQIGGRRAPARTAFLRHLKQAAAELDRAVEIRIERQAGLLRRFDEGVAQRVGVGTLGNVERPVGAVEFIVQALVALGFLEVGQNVGIAPARITELPPMIVVGRLAAHIDHGVDGTRAAEQPAARPIHAPALHRRLRRRLVAPVVSGPGELGDAGRHAHKKRFVRAAGFEQQHLGFGFGRQAGWPTPNRPSRRRR